MRFSPEERPSLELAKKSCEKNLVGEYTHPTEITRTRHGQ